MYIRNSQSTRLRLVDSESRMYTSSAILLYLIHSSVASPVCQEGQSERTFPIFAFSSRFFLSFPIFSLFFQIFGKFFTVGVALCSLDPPVATPLYNNIDFALMGYAILSNLSCEVHHLTCWYKLYLSLNTSIFTNQTNLECIVFLKIPLSLDWGAQMRWDKDHNIDY